MQKQNNSLTMHTGQFAVTPMREPARQNQARLSSALEIESVRFFIKDRKQAKKTAVQEIELIPVKISDNVVVVNENGSTNAIWVLDKFNLPKAKELIIQVSEKNGSRNIQLKIRSNVF